MTYGRTSGTPNLAAPLHSQLSHLQRVCTRVPKMLRLSLTRGYATASGTVPYSCR